MKELTLSSIWNSTLSSKEEREIKPRNYAWASEMGYPLVDRFLKMNGVKPTNPPNNRSKRKFFAGNIYEWIVWTVFNQSGLVISKQEEVWVKTGEIEVKGKSDFLVGGKPDFDKAEKEMMSYPMPEDMKWFFVKMIDGMKELFNKEVPISIKEIKSLSSFMMDRIEAKNSPIKQHSLQLLHYQMGMNIDMGSICYICRDDARLREYGLINVDELKKDYFKELSDLNGYLSSNQRPPLEKNLIWDGRFSKNLGIEYSPYLKLLYGFNEPEEYRLTVDSKVARWNRVLKRVKEGDKITDKNKAAIEEMEIEGFNVEELVKSMYDVPEEEI